MAPRTADVELKESNKVDDPESTSAPASFAAQSETMKVHAGPAARSGKRTVIIVYQEHEAYRDCIDTNMADQRNAFIEAVRSSAEWPDDAMEGLERRILDAADQADQTAAELDEEAKHNGLKRSGASELLDLMVDVKLFRTPEDKGYGVVVDGKQREAIPVLSDRFRSRVVKRYFEKHGQPPTEQATKDAIGVMNAKAIFSDVQEPVFTRYAEHDGRYYVDLANPAGPYVEITKDGWRLCEETPVNFYRSPGMLPLPVPMAGGRLEELQKFINVSAGEWPLLSGFLLSAALPKGPYPILIIQGEQGSAKTTAEKFIGMMIDPRHAGQRAECRSVLDLVLAANNCHLLQFDNLSGINTAMSDAFCRLSTGGGFATRKLYSDDEEVMFEVQRPVVMNGIEDLATRSDLMDRGLHLSLPRIPADRRRSGEEIEKEFALAWPRLTGALYEAIAACLRNLEQTTLENPPRMADFALRVMAAEESLGMNRGDFMKAYDANRETMHIIALEESVLVAPIEKLLEQSSGSWTGTATELRNKLYNLADPDDRRPTIWPRNPKALSGALRRIVTNLTHIGIGVDFDKVGGQRLIFIRRLDRRGASLESIIPLEE
jgi:hypothetical protein